MPVPPRVGPLGAHSYSGEETGFRAGQPDEVSLRSPGRGISLLEDFHVLPDILMCTASPWKDYSAVPRLIWIF